MHNYSVTFFESRNKKYKTSCYYKDDFSLFRRQIQTTLLYVMNVSAAEWIKPYRYSSVPFVDVKVDFDMSMFGLSYLFLALFPPPPPPPPPHSNTIFFGLTSGFTRLIMKTKNVCQFFMTDNRTKWTGTSNIKNCRWGGKEKEPYFCFRLT